MAAKDRNSEPRLGIPSIPFRTFQWFFGIFSVGTLTLATIGAWSAVSVGDIDSWHEIVAIVVEQITQAAAASIVGAAIVVEVGNMVIGAMIRQRARDRGREEGREEAREETLQELRKLISAWNRRRLDAQARGERFDEPPPLTNGATPTP
jgi:hypothetical protein